MGSFGILNRGKIYHRIKANNTIIKMNKQFGAKISF